MANYQSPLYERACSVFQRRVKQVYFQLNPFLERTNLKDEEAECYQPSSKFVVPRSSIVVCEQFDSDESQDWKVLNPEEFLEYLYSDGWADDCSLRVLEGELLELLKTLLCVLEKNEEVTSHSTFAYAKNKRQVHRCYVNSQDVKEEFSDQTLLIEFIYYGVNQKKSNEKKNKEPLVSWRDYKEMAAKAAGLTSLADIVDLMGSSKKKKKEGDFMSLVRAPKSTYTTAQADSQDIRIEALTAMKWADEFRALSSSRQRSQSMESPPKIGSDSIVPPSPERHSTITCTVDQNAGNGSELLAKMDEILFDKSKKVGRSRRANTFFGGMVGRRAPPGDEFYIDQLTPKHTEPFQASEYLQQLRQARMTEREKEIEEVKQLTERMKLNKLECLADDSRQSSDGSYKPFMRVYDRKLSFGEFYHFLQEGNKYDPRFKKGSSKKKKLSDGIKVRGSKSIGIRKSSKVTAVVEKPSKKVVSDRQRFANMVGGVTDSEPAKNHCLKNVFSDQKTESHGITRPPPSVGRGRRPNSMFSNTAPSTTHRRFDEQFYTTLPKITSPIFEGVSRTEGIGEQQSPLGNIGERHNRGYRGGYNKRTPTTTDDSDTDIESSDSPSYDEDDDFEDTVFDSKKLNRKYSIEKIKAMKSKKEKKPPVLNILKKFCRVNKMMNTLGSKPSKTPRKSVVDANKAKQSAKAFGMFRRLNKKGMMPKVELQREIGKMKHFEFLKHKDYELKIPDVVPPDFKSILIENFKNNLLNAMDYFVIRKEVITSSHNYETVTTVTFTRPVAYVRLHQVPKDS